jgi:hypothetical protein
MPNANALLTRRICATAVLACLFPYLAGCYTTRPVTTAAVPSGSEVSLAINDAGRVGLGERLGSGVRRINGRLVVNADTAFRVRVASLDFLSGEKSHWAGEEIQVPRSFVSTVSTRELSRTKSWLAVALVVGVLAATIATVSVVGGGSESENPKEPPPGQSTRIP